MVGGQALDLAARRARRATLAAGPRASTRARPARCFAAAVRVGALVGGARPAAAAPAHDATASSSGSRSRSPTTSSTPATARRRRAQRPRARQGDVSRRCSAWRRARAHAARARDAALAAVAPLGARAEPLRRDRARWSSRGSTRRWRWPRRRRHAARRAARRAAGRARAGAEPRARAAPDHGRRRAGRRPPGDEGRARWSPPTRRCGCAAAASPYVSRGGEKLAGALDAFGARRRGPVALDVGASTGGFTDCLLRARRARA